MSRPILNIMVKLGVNIDHVATLRQARRGSCPDPVGAALVCQKSGADSIVAHLREDRRHIQDADLLSLKKNLKINLNMEMSLAADIVDFALKLKPFQVTLVPEKRAELTTEGGLDVVKNFSKIVDALARFKAKGIRASLFIDPDIRQIKSAVKAGARIIEIHTGRYADARTKSETDKTFKQVKQAVGFARENGLLVNAGHGLDYRNVRRIAKLAGINELNIGYAIICQALSVGLGRAVQQMKGLVGYDRRHRG
ncbi:MAG: pyridoxine 5'-phosphate synthase [Candidatus Omnitrophota bacterium]